MDQRISCYLLQLRRHHPFLATLSLMATYQFDKHADKVSADGMMIRINPDYYQRFNTQQQQGLLLHLTLHNALLHSIRCGHRKLKIWNIAADIVVNQIIAEAGVFQPPPDTAHDPRYAGLSVEQVYEKLCSVVSKMVRKSGMQSGRCEDGKLQPGCGAGQANQADDDKIETLLSQCYPAVNDLTDRQRQQHSDPQAQREQKALENHWKAAFKQAETVQRMHQKNRGQLPAGLIREIEALYQPQLDWKTLLWRFVSKTPCDYSGYDRRFVYQKLYLEQLESESLNLIVAIDTSGSIEQEELNQFITELSAILNTYPFIKARLYFVDVAVDGPHPIESIRELPPITGGGGTDFRDLFCKVEQQRSPFEDTLCIYMTDGDGYFPDQAPQISVLWVVCQGGLDSTEFPFGEVARLAG